MVHLKLTKEDLHSRCIKMSKCVESVSQWMSENVLKMNHDKAELLLVVPKIQDLKMDIENCNIKAATNVRNLGVSMDSHLTTEAHVSKVVRSCVFHLINIG
eukprot:GHVU01166893.1.p1 GENE.GHVU01166893.1~~GHVU01166893.1.p1  ORF type:complete len:101 (+),score=7.59 GHVU01166893.1:75-377(+)